MSMSLAGYVLENGEGEALWFLGTRMTVKADAASTGSALSLIEQECPPGFGTPPHIHHVEDEAFYILEGSLVVTCGVSSWAAGPGGFVYLPKGIVHGFVVSDDGPARVLQLTMPAQFESFAREVGRRATGSGLPVPEEPDVALLLEAAGHHDIEIVLPGGPAPGS